MPAPTELRRAPVDITRTYHNRLSTLIFFFSLLSKSIDTTQSQHLPVHTSTPARGFFAQRNRFQPEDLSSSNLHPNPATDREQGAAASVVPARLGLKAVGKAQLFTASAFQNWSLSRAHRLGPAQARPRLRPQPVGNLSGDFYARTKKNQVTSSGWQRHDNIYICIFNSFSYIYMNLKNLLLCFTI